MSDNDLRNAKNTLFNAKLNIPKQDRNKVEKKITEIIDTLEKRKKEVRRTLLPCSPK